MYAYVVNSVRGYKYCLGNFSPTADCVIDKYIFER